MRKALACLAALLILAGGTAARAETRITLSFTGDVTLGGVERGRSNPESFDSYAAEKGYAYFFQNMQDLFLRDDLTLVNLEGTLTDSTRQENTKKTFRFRGATDYAKILRIGGIEACAIANNHIMDFGKQGYQSTVETLEKNRLLFCGNEYDFILDKKGVRIGFFAFQGGYLTQEHIQGIGQRIARMRAEGVGAIVCCFHAGQEYVPTRRKWDQERYAKIAVQEWGADLVVMHHPHVLQGIDVLDGRYVFYSLGNFCFGGNTTIRGQEGNASVRTLETMVLQMDLTFDDAGKLTGQEGRIYPCYMSSYATKVGGVNDYQPKLVTGAQAEGVIQRIQADTAFDMGAIDPEEGYLRLPWLAAPEEKE